MKILMICHLPLDPTLGGAKVYLENYQSFLQAGTEVKLVGPETYANEELTHLSEDVRIQKYAPLIKDYIEREGSQYDIIEVENTYLPYERAEINFNGILCVRSVLLVNHFDTLKLPTVSSLKNTLKEIVYSTLNKYPYEERRKISLKCLRNADCINVPNELDKQKIVSLGIEESKVLVGPYGYFEKDEGNFDCERERLDYSEISFIGSFDPRKGELEFPKIVREVLKEFPETKFNLLGCKGRYKNKEEVLSKFHQDDRKNLNIVMHFDPAQLNELLGHTKIGLFPSHLESFGFGLLELMLRGIPTVGYEIPGPSDILLKDLQSERGDWQLLVRHISRLLNDKEFYLSKSLESLNHGRLFKWELSAKKQLEFYQNLLN